MRYRTASAILLLALLAPAAAAQTQGVTEIRLENGLTVLIKEVHTAPVFTAQLWFKAGSRNEHTGITGISHLLEHMLFKSSRNFKAGEISKLVSERGGVENAATWTDFTYYWQLLSPEHLEFSIKTLAERAGRALLRQDELDKERTVVLSEMDGRENDPGWILYRDVSAAAFAAHPYQWPVIGWRPDIENVTRSQLWDYYQTYYHPNNATLVLVGDIDAKKAAALARKYFGPIPSSRLPDRVPTPEPQQRGERRVTVRMEGSAPRIIIAYHIPGIEHPDTYPLMVLDQILSGGRTGRLYQALVEKQIAVSAWSGSGSRKDPSLFLLGATAAKDRDAAGLEKALLEQVEAAKASPPTEQEMASARNQLEAYVVFQNDSVSDQGEQLGYYNTVSSWRFLETLIPRIKAVTPEQVLEAARKYLVADNSTVGVFVPLNGSSSGAGQDAPPQPEKASRYPWACGYTQRGKASGVSTGVTPGAARPKKNAENANTARPARVVLDNGLVVIVQENHSNPTVAVNARVLAGSCFDPKGKAGTALLTAEMITRGTAGLSAFEIANKIESVGASLDSSADTEFAEVNGRALARDLPVLLEVLADELRNPSFPENQFDIAKNQALSRLQQTRESTDEQAFRAFFGAVFPEGHPYHQPSFDIAVGQMQSITRGDCADFHKSRYRPDTTAIVIVGDVKPDEAISLVAKHFAGWTAEGPRPTVDIPTVPPQDHPARIDVPVAGKSETTVVFGYALGVNRSSPDFYAVRLMNQALGGSGALTSLLGEEVREKQGLAYDVYSAFAAGLGAGPWYAALGANPKDVEKAVAAVRQVIERFRDKGPTEQEFRRARDFTIGVLSIALESNAGVARVLSSAEFYGLGVDYIRRYPELYRSVTIEQVRAAARKYLRPDKATLVTAGPRQ